MSINLLAKFCITILKNFILAQCVAKVDGRQIAKKILADIEIVSVCGVVALIAIGITSADNALVIQVIGANGVFRALLAIL